MQWQTDKKGDCLIRISDEEFNRINWYPFPLDESGQETIDVLLSGATVIGAEFMWGGESPSGKMMPDGLIIFIVSARGKRSTLIIGCDLDESENPKNPFYIEKGLLPEDDELRRASLSSKAF